MNIYQNCQNNPDILVLIVLSIIFCVFLFLIIHNIRRFQSDINQYTMYGMQPIQLDDDGELSESDEYLSTYNTKGNRKKKDTPPSVSGCLWQQFIIALIGLLTALISFLALSNPLITVTFGSVI